MAPLTALEWQTRAQALRIETGLFIDGRLCEAEANGRFAVINPANGDLVAEMACATAVDVARAVASASAAWHDGRWRHMPT